MAKTAAGVSTLMRARRTAGWDDTDADGACQAEPLSLPETPCLGPSVLFEGTPSTSWMRQIRTFGSQGGATKPIDAPCPYPIILLGAPRGRRDKPGDDPVCSGSSGQASDPGWCN